jgi:GT2 family glycosyltransferase
MKLSVIVPFVNEFPQVLFTLRNLGEELLDRTDFEVIAINNFCDEVATQARAQTAAEVEKLQAHLSRTGYRYGNHTKTILDNLLATYAEDKAGDSIKACTRGHEWLKYVEYKDKLSHWNAKRIGCKEATGDVFLFVDSHCIVGRNSIHKMLDYYEANEERLHGTLHLPLTYKILEYRKLIYKLMVDRDGAGLPAGLHYSFTPFRPSSEAYEVPCMSTCGMMISRRIYNEVGGWPEQLGIYGGGENFMNYTLSVLGYKKWIYPNGYLCHHGEKRGYHWNYDDHIRNRILATFLFGGRLVAERFVSIAKGKPAVLNSLLNDVVSKCGKHRHHIESRQVMTIDDWISSWEQNQNK